MAIAMVLNAFLNFISKGLSFAVQKEKANQIYEKEWTGDIISGIAKRYGVSRKTYCE